MIRLAPLPSLVDYPSMYRCQELATNAVLGAILAFLAKKLAKAYALISCRASKSILY